MILKYVWRVFITVVLVYMFREYFAPAFEAVWLELSFALNQWTHHSFQMKYFCRAVVWIFVITMFVGYIVPTIERMVSCNVAQNPFL